jgi:tetratricopeptide (TPR) repeat protein
LRLWPDDYDAHYNLGKIYQEKGLKGMALKEYQEVLNLQPDHPEILQAIKEIR